MQNKNIFFNLIVIIFIAILGFFIYNGRNAVERIKYVKIAGENIKVELALDKEIQERGLSGRENLEAGTGMLFVFPKIGEYYFWMKAMNFSIDIIWIDEGMNVIYIKHDAQPEEFLETYGPEQNSKYVLEVNAGFSDKFNLKEGDRVEFTPTPIF